MRDHFITVKLIKRFKSFIMDTTTKSQVITKVEEWLAWDKNEKTSSEIKSLADSENYEQLSKILLNRLNFGTAGLRGRMGPGYAAMNDLVIIQTGQGLLAYLESAQKELLSTNGIVIGYDGRYNSKRFAELTASIFIHAGYPVRLYSQIVPTPLIPFAVNKYNSAVGIMVTASHNPKEDNGYKVYGSNASQIISPVDKEIQQQILLNLSPRETSWDVNILNNTKLLSDPLKDSFDEYLAFLQNSILDEHLKNNSESKVLFTYTAMHGVGYRYIKEVFDLFRITFIPVEEQKDPDPEFSTVKYPNPEEGKDSLDLAIKTADRNNSPIIIANDPDADRLALAEKDKKTGTWKVFSGNELGALMGWWLLKCHKEKSSPTPLQDCYMLSSTVSSKILKTMATKEGFNFIETLTGFKWMGNKAYELINENKTVLFAFEEAIGFMCGSNVLDKDGVSAALHFATMASYLYNQNITVSEKLQELYETYGFHLSCNSYFICYDQEKINTIFERIRNYHGTNEYPKSILDGKYKIKTIRDLTTGYDNSQPDFKAILPVSKSSQMITFGFDNGLVCTLRTSGTEPKVKYYTELCAAPGEDKKTAEATLTEMVDGIINEMFEPEANNLIPQQAK